MCKNKRVCKRKNFYHRTLRCLCKQRKSLQDKAEARRNNLHVFIPVCFTPHFAHYVRHLSHLELIDFWLLKDRISCAKMSSPNFLYWAHIGLTYLMSMCINFSVAGKLQYISKIHKKQFHIRSWKVEIWTMCVVGIQYIPTLTQTCISLAFFFFHHSIWRWYLISYCLCELCKPYASSLNLQGGASLLLQALHFNLSFICLKCASSFRCACQRLGVIFGLKVALSCMEPEKSN